VIEQPLWLVIDHNELIYARICAWCQTNKHRITILDWIDAPDSHGICEECSAETVLKWIADRKREQGGEVVAPVERERA